MKNRILAVLVAAGLSASLGLCASAANADVPLQEKAAVLKELEIMEGDQNGDLNLGSYITRAEFTKLLVAASPYKDSISDTAGTDPYPDVSHRSWYAPYVRLAVDRDLAKGDLTGLFHPEDNITLAESVTMAVRLLGYTDDDFTSPWPGGQMGLYRSLELNEGVTATENGELLTRRDCLHLFYNLLTAKDKHGNSYITQLGYTLNSDGEVDVNALFDVDADGPIPLTGNWQNLLPFAVERALVYRDGERSTLAELEEWDLLYWIEDPALLIAYSDQSMNAVNAGVKGPVEVKEGWEAKLPFSPDEATSVTRNGTQCQVSLLQEGDLVYYSEYTRALAVYAKQVSGTIEAITPSLAAPTAVVIAGQSYALETLEAQYAFSDLGQFRKGDTVTVSLGRNGGVAAVKTLEEDQVITQVGVFTALGTQSYTDTSDQSYASKVVKLVAADGKEYVYPYAPGTLNEDQLKAGDLIEVTQAGGNVTAKKISSKTLSGTVNASGTTLGKLKISPDAEILDTYGDSTFQTLSPSRLAGVTLSGGEVRYYSTDESGSIDRLILEDVTGDVHCYGVLTDKETVDFQMILQGSYTVDLNGTTTVFPISGKKFSASVGPVTVKLDGGQVQDLRNLSKVEDVVLHGQSVSHAGKSYLLSDGVSFYLYNSKEKEYTLATRSQVENGNYTLTAWYDKPEAQGGRVRVVTAQAN